MDRTTDRTSRATRGTSGITIARMTARRPAREIDTSPMASRMAGIDMSPSMTRMTTPSSQRR